MISSKPDLFDAAARALSRRYGPVDVRSELLEFDFTPYYENEMGPGLKRLFVSFEPLLAPERLTDVKLDSNAIEDELAQQAEVARPINLDPGYVTEANLVLASMKRFAHRIYLRDGVHAEVTLLYRKGDWKPLPWTFPDFAAGTYNRFLSESRNKLRQQLQEGA